MYISISIYIVMKQHIAAAAAVAAAASRDQPGRRRAGLAGLGHRRLGRSGRRRLGRSERRCCYRCCYRCMLFYAPIYRYAYYIYIHI